MKPRADGASQESEVYWDCSLMCFTETRPHQDTPDDNISIGGYETVQPDRDRTRAVSVKEGVFHEKDAYSSSPLPYPMCAYVHNYRTVLHFLL